MSENTPSTPSELDSDPFLRLHKMSTTAGLGSGDYVAVNAASLAALLLGIASWLVLWGSLLLLIIPIIGLICSIVAIKQVTDSNGTQTGRGLAVLGMLLSLGIGGGFTGHIVLESIRNSKEEQQVTALLEEFGALIRDAKYAQAYDLFDDHFRSRVPEQKFIDAWKQANGSAFRRHASGIMLIGFSKIPAQQRADIIFNRDDNGWKIDQLPDIFPVETAPSNGSAPPSSSRGGGPIGPPSPTKSN
jgi:hypothetical protein